MTTEEQLRIIETYGDNPFTATLGVAGYYEWIKGLMWTEVEIVTSKKG